MIDPPEGEAGGDGADRLRNSERLRRISSRLLILGGGVV